MWKSNLLVMDLKSVARKQLIIGKFLRDHQSIKVTAAETVDEFAVLQRPPSILREGRDDPIYFKEYGTPLVSLIVFTHASDRFDFWKT